MENLSIYLNVLINKRIVIFIYNNYIYEIVLLIIKCFSVVYFMLFYYIWGNIIVFFNMIKLKEKIFDGGKWFE